MYLGVNVEGLEAYALGNVEFPYLTSLEQHVDSHRLEFLVHCAYAPSRWSITRCLQNDHLHDLIDDG